MAARTTAIFAVLWAISFAEFALGQVASLKESEQPLNPLETFQDPIKISTAWDKAFKFIIDSANRKNIGQSLRKANNTQRIEDRREFQYWMPHTEIGSDQQPRQLSDSLREELGFAMAKQAVDAIPLLKSFTKSLRFKFNLLAEQRDQEAEKRRRRNFKIKPKPKKKENAQSTSGFGLHNDQGSDASEYEIRNTHEQEKWRQMGQIEADLQPDVMNRSDFEGQQNPQNSRFSLAITQGAGFYTLRLPLGKGSTQDGMSHLMRVPIYAGLKLGRDYDGNGKTTRSGFYNLFMQEQPHATMVNVFYDHERLQYGSECNLTTEQNRTFSIETTTPSGINISDRDFSNEKAEYRIAFRTPL